MGESKNLFEFLMGEENVNQLYILILGAVTHVGAVTSWSKEEITYIANFKNISC